MNDFLNNPFEEENDMLRYNFWDGPFNLNIFEY